MKPLPDFFDPHRKLLKQLTDISKKKKIRLYLVGGTLRDFFLKRTRKNPDFDFCLKEGAINFARQLAKEIRAGFVVLDKEHGCARVVKKAEERCYTLDFSDFRGTNLEDDLVHRDFTINSIAVELDRLFDDKGLKDCIIDPLSGIDDLKKRVIRMAGCSSFDDDPLRVLRAFSLAALLGFSIEKKTLKDAIRKKDKLKSVSCERIRDELFRLFSSEKAYEAIRALDSTRILGIVIPEIKSLRRFRVPSKFGMDIWKHSMDTVEELEGVLDKAAKDPSVSDYLDREVSSGRKRVEILKLACLLHDLGKPDTFRTDGKKVMFYGHERLGSRLIEKSGVRLRLSNDEVRSLKRITLLHLRPGYLVTNEALTPRAKFRFFRDCAEDAVSILLLSLADERATKGYSLLDKIRKRYEKIVWGLVKEYFAELKKPAPVRLADGNDIMKALGLKPSATVGEILRELKELQALGRIKTKDEAIKAAKGIVDKK